MLTSNSPKLFFYMKTTTDEIKKKKKYVAPHEMAAIVCIMYKVIELPP